MISLCAEYGLLKHSPNGQLRSYAENTLPAAVFGRNWVAMKKLFGGLAAPDGES